MTIVCVVYVASLIGCLLLPFILSNIKTGQNLFENLGKWNSNTWKEVKGAVLFPILNTLTLLAAILLIVLKGVEYAVERINRG